ncbi:hypothetical protein DM02DRAFT_634593 [Periconia macrospinosa]|uniref:Uncharacterized protein n=1 Tax=Periconia macrospinosa TaxID=97972 RepID=A0A2V1D5R1_9PLEO|nr:hypothetical protein DM02DRAFT_634593 [Periconia macrospinosa]
MSVLHRCVVALLSFSLLFVSTVLASDITTYADGNCQRSFTNLNVVNGYPDGVCTPLQLSPTGSPSSFQIAKLDPGCAVTLYGADENPLSCSSSLKIVAEMGTCYNATWAYYSVDGCFSPKSNPSSSILPLAATPSLSPPPAMSTFNQITTSSPSSLLTSSPSPSSSSSTSSPSPDSTPSPPPPPRAIIGGITASVAGLALFLTLGLFLLRRRQRRLKRSMNKPLPSIPRFELPNDGALIEAGAHASIVPPQRAAIVGGWARKVDEEMREMEPVEIGRNSVYEDRIERLRNAEREGGEWGEWKGHGRREGERTVVVKEGNFI